MRLPFHIQVSLNKFGKTYIHERALLLERLGENESTLTNKDIMKYCFVFRASIMGRKFCHTNRGYIGLVPKNTRPGDRIYVIYGAQTPFVLRAVTQEDSVRSCGENNNGSESVHENEAEEENDSDNDDESDYENEDEE